MEIAFRIVTAICALWLLWTFTMMAMQVREIHEHMFKDEEPDDPPKP